MLELETQQKTRRDLVKASRTRLVELDLALAKLSVNYLCLRADRGGKSIPLRLKDFVLVKIKTEAELAAAAIAAANGAAKEAEDADSDGGAVIGDGAQEGEQPAAKV